MLEHIVSKQDLVVKGFKGTHLSPLMNTRLREHFGGYIHAFNFGQRGVPRTSKTEAEYLRWHMILHTSDSIYLIEMESSG
jgi:hypothetical protein